MTSKSISGKIVDHLPRIEGLSDFVSEGGGKFIGHISESGSLAFVHSLYCKRKIDLSVVHESFGFMPDNCYIEFVSEHDGASLYCGLMLIYSHNANYSRSMLLDDQSSPFLFEEIEAFKLKYPSIWNNGWRPIGSFVANKLYDICINYHGNYEIYHDGEKLIWFESMHDLFEWAKSKLFPLLGPRGVIDDTYESAERAIGSATDGRGGGKMH